METTLLIVLVAAIAVWAGTALLRSRAVPTPVVLVIAGVALGFIPAVPDTSLNPHVVLLGFLPLLVFHAASLSSPRDFLRQAAPIGLLAVGLVLLTAGGVALAAHHVAHLSWPMSFVLGTAVGPTDAVAATSIIGRLGLPRQLTVILEGEALFNDATALVLYGAAVTAATTGHVSAAHTVGAVAYSAAVGAAIGGAVALVGHQVRRLVNDPPMEIVLSILLAYAAYLPAEAVHASGVLAAVTAGLVLGSRSSRAMSGPTRLQSTVFWDTLVFLLDGALFILVGLSLHTFTAGARGPLGRLVLTGVAVIAVVVVGRLVWMAAMSAVLRPIRRLGGPRHRREQAVLGWSGMRGAITLAAALAVPVAARDGRPLAGRDDVVYLAFAVIFVTLGGQGLTLPWVARKFRPAADPGAGELERRVRLELVAAALARLAEEEGRGALPCEVTDALRAQYEARRRRLDRPDEEGAEVHDATVGEERELRRDLVAVERRRLQQLREEHRLSAGAVREIEHDLDLDEARLR